MRPKNPRGLNHGQVSQLVVSSRDGRDIKVVCETTDLIETPNWTPDGKWLVYNGDGRLFKISPDGEVGPSRVNTTPIEDLNNDHVLSPDGGSAFISANDGHLYKVSIDGGVPTLVSDEQDPARGRSRRCDADFRSGVGPCCRSGNLRLGSSRAVPKRCPCGNRAGPRRRTLRSTVGQSQV
ncbi:hypothetical protein C9418_24975 [Rhizobium sp. SEMIA 4032]|nr:hypothetical protein C9418_24975 [Rhizobium sp. SEMIA 4032]